MLFIQMIIKTIIQNNKNNKYIGNLKTIIQNNNNNKYIGNLKTIIQIVKQFQ